MTQAHRSSRLPYFSSLSASPPSLLRQALSTHRKGVGEGVVVEGGHFLGLFFRHKNFIQKEMFFFLSVRPLLSKHCGQIASAGHLDWDVCLSSLFSTFFARFWHRFRFRWYDGYPLLLFWLSFISFCLSGICYLGICLRDLSGNESGNNSWPGKIIIIIIISHFYPILCYIHLF